MADMTFHNVTKIEVLKRTDGRSYLTRDIVIHNNEWNSELGKRIATQTEINLFLDDKSASKLVYNNDKSHK